MSESVEIRVCFIAPKIYPLFNPLIRVPYSGAEAQLYELASCFGPGQDLDIHVITDDYGQEEVEYYSGVLVYRHGFETRQKPFIKRLFSRGSSLWDLLEKIDAQIYILAAPCGAMKEIAEFCRKKRRSFVYRVSHLRECDGSYVRSKSREGAQFQWALKNARFVICQTEEQRRLLKRREGIEAQVIPNTVSSPPPSSVGRTDVIWVGQALEWKQPELFLRQAVTLPNQRFTMISMPVDIEYFENLVEKTRAAPNLGFENSVPYQELSPFFERAKLLVNTSRYEGFPFVWTQALAYGVPIASLNVDPDGILEKEEIGICAHGSEARLAETIQDLVTYERQWRRYHENVKRVFEEQFSLQQIKQEYLKLFVQCLHR